VVFFGYTQCPDVCPTTLAEWAEVRRQLGPDGARVQVIFVTLDPERDTPGLLAHYVQAFDPGTLALTGTPAEIATVAKDFKVFYEKVPGAAPGQYTLNHTAASYVFDPQGRLRLFIRQGQAVSDTVADLRVLLAAKPS
jgi:protein SCO1/2